MIGAGGTPGGTGQFLLGVGLALVGAYLLTQHVTVTSGGWGLWGYNSFGLSLVPFIGGIGFLFFDGRSRVGWWLLYAGLLVIFAGILMNLNLYFQPTSLFNTLMMLVMLAAGVGLVVRSLTSR